MASGDAVEQIKNRLSIVDVVAPYVELHQAGKNLKGKCPFHSEKTPSFNVSQDRGTYHCFGCGVGGDMFTFVEAIDGVDFKGALKILADKAGVELVPEDAKKRSERDSEYAVLEAATVWWQRQLQEATAASEYLEKRGVTAQTIAKWRLGYTPDEWRVTATHLKKDFSLGVLQKAGLVKGEVGKEPYDVFRDRIMFPIFDASGRVVAFSGRLLSKDSEAAKYINSPETELFNKSEILYGYDKAKQHIRTFNFSLIVEGQFDVVLSHQAGYTNTVAVSGTALTAHHVALLQRLSNRVVLALDADKAGIAAVKRAAQLMLSRGMDVKVANLPKGTDPADMVLQAPQDFKKAIGAATHVIEFLLEQLKTEAKDDRNYKLRVRDEVLPFVAHIESHIDREHFEAIVAKAVSTTTDAIHQETNRIIEIQNTKPSSVDKKETPTTNVPLIKGRSRLDSLCAYLVATHGLIDVNFKHTLERAVQSISGDSIESLEASVPAEILSPLVFELEKEWSPLSPDETYEHIARALDEWRVVWQRHRLVELRQKLTAAEAIANSESVTEILDAIASAHQKLAQAPIMADDLKNS